MGEVEGWGEREGEWGMEEEEVLDWMRVVVMMRVITSGEREEGE